MHQVFGAELVGEVFTLNGCTCTGIELGVADMYELAALVPRLRHVRSLELGGTSFARLIALCCMAHSVAVRAQAINLGRRAWWRSAACSHVCRSCTRCISTVRFASSGVGTGRAAAWLLVERDRPG